MENKSEVARLMRQIDAEVESGKQGLVGLAQGTARHLFINTKMEKIGAYHEELQALIGDAALPLIIEKLDQLQQPLQNSVSQS